ncbi:MAG: S1C family serine protease [Actinomycetota bacterium]
MADGVFDDDEFIERPPAAADRVWRHPSEVAAAARATQRRATRRIWGVGFASALGGALAASTVWYVNGPGQNVEFVTQQVAVAPIESVAPRLTPADEWATEVTATARPATAIIPSTDGTHAVAGAIAVHAGGYLLTSGRAVGSDTQLVVHTHNGGVIEAVVLGYDDETDLTVLKTSEPVTSADVAASPANDGDVVAVVDPTGASRRGVVTDLAASASAIDGDLLVGFTSLDSPRNDLLPGSPVVDATGAVVGITTAAEPASPVTVVPIDVANAVAESIITEGRVWHAWLGVTVSSSESGGVVVTGISPDGPAARAGLTQGDVLLAIDDVDINSAASLVSRLRHYRPDDTVSVLVARRDEHVLIDALLDVDPADFSETDD